MTPTYQAAHEKFNKVSQAHTAATKAYRARKIGDEEFLASRKAFEQAKKDFDVAEASERERPAKEKRAEKQAAGNARRERKGLPPRNELKSWSQQKLFE